jgi:hypothetical protein
MAGADITNLDYLRGLGLTSLGLQQQGEQAFTGAMGRIQDIPFFDISQFFVTPEQQQQAGIAASTLAAAPIPSEAARAEQSSLLTGLQAGQGGGLTNWERTTANAPGAQGPGEYKNIAGRWIKV